MTPETRAERMLKQKLLDRNGVLQLDSGDSIRWIRPKPGMGGLLEVRGPDGSTACHMTPDEIAMLRKALAP